MKLPERKFELYLLGGNMIHIMKTNWHEKAATDLKYWYDGHCQNYFHLPLRKHGLANIFSTQLLFLSIKPVNQSINIQQNIHLLVCSFFSLLLYRIHINLFCHSYLLNDYFFHRCIKTLYIQVLYIGYYRGKLIHKIYHQWNCIF